MQLQAPDRPDGDETISVGQPPPPMLLLARRVWTPAPVRKPVIAAELEQLPWVERSAEVVRYALLSAVYWLSPGGFLREWLRVCLWLAVTLVVAAILIIPPVTALLEGFRDWTGLIGATVDNISSAIAALPPIALAIATAFMVVRLIKHYAGNRRPQHRHPYNQYE